MNLALAPRVTLLQRSITYKWVAPNMVSKKFRVSARTAHKAFVLDVRSASTAPI